MITEDMDPRYSDLDTLAPAEIVRIMAEAERSSAEAVLKAADRIALISESVVGSLQAGGRIVFAGAGTSGRIAASEAAECPPTFGTDPDRIRALVAGGKDALLRAREGAEDNFEGGRNAARELGVCGNDLVIGITAGGKTPFVMGVLAQSRALGAGTSLITSNPDADCPHLTLPPVILEVGPEVVAGSTRLKSATAAKIALNALTTSAMARIGKLYGSLMVDMRPTNEKLRLRAVRIVARIASVSESQAQAALEKTCWAIKPAVLVVKGLAPGQALEVLARKQNNLRNALEELK